MFKKIKKFLFAPVDATYVLIRDMLREILLPLRFVEDEAVPGGNIAKFRRGTPVVELNCDFREQQFWITATSGSGDPIHRLPQVWMNFNEAQYTPEKEQEIRTALQKWLNTLDKP